MTIGTARYGRELEALLGSSVRRGRIDPRELYDTFIRLELPGHEALEDDRRFALELVVEALTCLPSGFAHATSIRVVPNLSPYQVQRVACGLGRAGFLSDGSLVVEANAGEVSLLSLVPPLCVVQHEQEKARALLEQSAATDAPSPEDVGALAFALGLDPERLARADAVTEGGISALLRSGRALPPVRVHAELSPSALAARACSHAEAILSALAEMGLLHRPLHLWVGDSVITDCLSPYARELREPLLLWATHSTDELGSDLHHAFQPAAEDLLYAVARDFLRHEPTLERERADAERSVGILRFSSPVAFEIVDLGRVDPQLIDPRIAGWHIEQAPAPVLVRVDLPLDDPDGVGLASLLDALGGRLDSVRVVLEGTAVNGQPGTIVLPHLMLRWAGDEKIAVPNATPIDVDALLGFADAEVQDGAVLSIPSPALLSPAQVVELSSRHGLAAVEVGGAAWLSVVTDARWRGVLREEAAVQWALVASQPGDTERPTLQSLSGVAALAVTALRQIGCRSAPEPRRARERQSEDQATAPTRPTYRIKA